MGVSSTILYGNCIEKNQPVSGTGHHKVVLKGKYKGQKSSFTLDEDILSKHMMLVGGTGCGKSTLFYHLFKQIRQNLSSEDVLIVFDTKGDFYKRFRKPEDYVIGNSKQYRDEKFEEVVKCAVRSIEKYSENQSDEKYMMVQSGGSHMKVFLKDIVYAEVYNRKVIIHTRDTNIEYYGKLQELSEIAGADFFRTHRAYLVHFKYVQKYDANCVTMENGTALIAKQNYSEFVKQYLKYNQRKGKEIG